MAENEFYSYKKLVIFGSEKTGKASFSKRLETDSVEESSEEGNERSKKYNLIY
ncbi:MAG: hypothetical protein MJ252_18120 [archaeon]|nr:hypothetical protein [archaeon]